MSWILVPNSQKAVSLTNKMLSKPRLCMVCMALLKFFLQIQLLSLQLLWTKRPRLNYSQLPYLCLDKVLDRDSQRMSPVSYNPLHPTNLSISLSSSRIPWWVTWVRVKPLVKVESTFLSDSEIVSTSSMVKESFLMNRQWRFSTNFWMRRRTQLKVKGPLLSGKMMRLIYSSMVSLPSWLKILN